MRDEEIPSLVEKFRSKDSIKVTGRRSGDPCHCSKLIIRLGDSLSGEPKIFDRERLGDR